MAEMTIASSSGSQAVENLTENYRFTDLPSRPWLGARITIPSLSLAQVESFLHSPSTVVAAVLFVPGLPDAMNDCQLNFHCMTFEDN